MIVLLAGSAISVDPASACPFCNTLKPTLSQQRESAAAVALGEAAQSEHGRTTVRVHQVLKGQERLGAAAADIEVEGSPKPGALLLLFGTLESSAASLRYTAVPVNETGYAYFARSPDLRTKRMERLAYFAAYLEHPEALVAEDAFAEFSHAPLEDVVGVLSKLPMEEFRAWIVDPGYPDDRKGFLGLALGLAKAGRDRKQNAELLHQLVVEPRDDFRAGFDGILAGYLLAAGEPGLDLIEARYLADPHAAEGDVRHGIRALRFYQEYGPKYGRGISAARLSSAMRRLIDRPNFAAAAITDLARWEDWGAVAQVSNLYARTKASETATRRAIAGYLLACPGPEASAELSRLRKLDPAGIRAAEQAVEQLIIAD